MNSKESNLSVTEVIDINSLENLKCFPFDIRVEAELRSIRDTKIKNHNYTDAKLHSAYTSKNMNDNTTNNSVFECFHDHRGEAALRKH